MTTRVDHALLTRFNLPSQGHESIVRARDNWLRDRVELFERHCLPSVRAQTSRDFSWLVYFDVASPAWLREWIASHEERGHFRPLFREEVPRSDLLADIRAATGGVAGALVTTNLDNDDSIARDFVARVQSAPVPGSRAAVYVGDGLILRDGRLYRRRDRFNAFCSVRETWHEPVTCWSEWHNRLHRHMPVVVLGGRPGWVQVVHGGNVSNRVRGRRVGPSAYREDFPGVLEEVPEPRRSEWVRETVVEAPVRLIREAGRAASKRAVDRVLGRDGLDRVKSLVESARRRRA
ncbi:glycosyltransferase [Geodermatophilus sp. SYSU D00766]